MENPRLTKEAYWEAVKKHSLLPNFWMSEEYIEKAELVWHSGIVLSRRARPDLYCGWMQTEPLEWFFPPLGRSGKFLSIRLNVYSSFLQTIQVYGWEEFLDYQYIYNPVDFLALQGHKWKQFRQDIKKYPKRADKQLLYLNIAPDTFQDDITALVMTWTKEKTLYDPEVLVKYALCGENRWGLFANGNLVGMNIWDENFKFINYRYCIDNGSPDLNRYLRHQFYTHPLILSKRKLVNDGGSLDNAGLREFKLRLNPYHVYTVTSYKQENTNENQS